MVRLNPGLHDAPRHDSRCFTKTATAAASDLFFTSPRCSSSLALERQANALQASTSAGCCLQSFLYFILLLERERVMVGSVDCKHPRVFSRRRGLQRGWRGCQCSSGSLRFSDLSFQGRLTAFLVNNFSCSVGVKVTACTTRRMRQGLRWVCAAAHAPHTGPISPEQHLGEGGRAPLCCFG